MSIWSRISYVFRGDRLNREIDEEFADHIEEAIAAGNDPAEVRRSSAPNSACANKATTPASSPGSIAYVPTWCSAGAS